MSKAFDFTVHFFRNFCFFTISFFLLSTINISAQIADAPASQPDANVEITSEPDGITQDGANVVETGDAKNTSGAKNNVPIDSKEVSETEFVVELEPINKSISEISIEVMGTNVISEKTNVINLENSNPSQIKIRSVTKIKISEIDIVDLVLEQDCENHLRTSIIEQNCSRPTGRLAACQSINGVETFANILSRSCSDPETFDLSAIDNDELMLLTPKTNTDVSCEIAWQYYRNIAPEFEQRQVNVIEARRAKLWAKNACGTRIASGEFLASENGQSYLSTANIRAYKTPQKVRSNRQNIVAGTILKIKELEGSDWFQVEVHSNFQRRAKFEIAFIEKKKGFVDLSALESGEVSVGRNIRYASGLALQQQLNARGCDVGTVDGSVGPKTRQGFERLWIQNRGDLPEVKFVPELLKTVINFNIPCGLDIEQDFSVGLISACLQYRNTRDIFRNNMALARAPGGGCGFAEGYKSKNLANNAAMQQCAAVNRVDISECRIVFTQ